ncbi:hypothetical protein RugamoR57_37430 [Duganella caerulea]|uniref:hypothetical protein n=1 Tax=Duganella caerulea TaxID=2885762 RepID=UPI0030E9EA81
MTTTTRTASPLRAALAAAEQTFEDARRERWQEFEQRQAEIAAIDAENKRQAEIRANTVPTSSLLTPIALTTPLFSVYRRKSATAALPHVTALYNANGRGYVRYEGPQLTQSHQTLLLALLQLQANRVVDEPLLTRPRDLILAMRWTDNKRNRERLAELIDDMHKSRLRIWAADQTERTDALRATLISSWQPSSDETALWTINLDRSAASLFNATTPTHLNLNVRSQLQEGIATFLYGFVRANTCIVEYKFRDLQAICGSTAKDSGEFGDSVCAALDQLESLGVIKGHKRLRGAVKINK